MGEGDTVQVVSVGKAVVVVLPEHYFKHQALTLEHSPERNLARSSIDTKSAKATKQKGRYSVDGQEGFLDELELAGFTEDDLRAAGWTTDAELNHAPG